MNSDMKMYSFGIFYIYQQLEQKDNSSKKLLDVISNCIFPIKERIFRKLIKVFLRQKEKCYAYRKMSFYLQVVL